MRTVLKGYSAPSVLSAKPISRAPHIQVRAGRGFRSGMSYSVTDLKVLEDYA